MLNAAPSTYQSTQSHPPPPSTQTTHPPQQFLPPPGYQLFFSPGVGYYYGPPIPSATRTYQNPHTISAPALQPLGPQPPVCPPPVSGTAPRVPLGDITNVPKRAATSAATGDAPAAKRHCPATASSSTSATPAPPGPAVFGVGPSAPPASSGHVEPEPAPSSSKTSAARDVWACTVPVDAHGKRIPQPPGTSNLVNPHSAKVECIFCG